MVAIFGYSRDAIFAAVKEMYTAVATESGGPFHFPVGRAACRAVGYPEEALRVLPETAVESFAGVGYPFRADAIRAGDTVLDIGSGSGTDALIASRIVGPRGMVWALDMTPAMAQKLRRLVASLGIANLQVIEGSAEAIPLPDASVDVVTSNGVLNLVPDKRRGVA
jgi:protein-L-isoaspartate O-methyltransferase